jgi:hypothetical protein
MPFFAIGTWIGEGVQVSTTDSAQGKLTSEIKRFTLVIECVTSEICAFIYTDEQGVTKRFIGYTVEENIGRAMSEAGNGFITLKYEADRDIIWGGLSVSADIGGGDVLSSSVVIPFFRQQKYT